MYLHHHFQSELVAFQIFKSTFSVLARLIIQRLFLNHFSLLVYLSTCLRIYLHLRISQPSLELFRIHLLHGPAPALDGPTPEVEFDGGYLRLDGGP